VAGQAQRDPAGVSAPGDARRALLGRLIDHAALFPPASLPMAEALAEDRRARATPEAWMLDRFIVPASRMSELAATVMPSAAPGLSVVLDGAGGAQPDRWQPALQQDLRAVARTAGSGFPVELVEVRLPGAAVGADLLAAARERVAEALGADVTAYFEVVLGDGVAQTIAAMGDTGARAKVRCGGAAPPPPAEALATFVARCRDAGVVFKATAGLHHPIRRGDAHGFLNLLAGAIFAHAEGLGEPEIAALLAEDDAAAFEAGPGGLAVHHLDAGPAEIARARAELFASFGSCSFSEPVEDLKALGIL
jgi:hypothetical protein